MVISGLLLSTAFLKNQEKNMVTSSMSSYLKTIDLSVDSRPRDISGENSMENNKRTRLSFVERKAKIKMPRVTVPIRTAFGGNETTKYPENAVIKAIIRIVITGIYPPSQNGFGGISLRYPGCQAFAAKTAQAEQAGTGELHLLEYLE